MKTSSKTNPPAERRCGHERTGGTRGPGKHDLVSAAPKLLSPDSSASTRRGRILVVDDDPGVRDALLAVLAEEGYAALPAGGGLQALALAASTPFDLVLLDLNLPGQNGWDTFERLTAEHPTVPIIIITARSNQWFTAVGAGAGALLEKPLDIPILLEAIARLLAAPPEEHLARMAGRKADFVYAPGHPCSAKTQANLDRSSPVAEASRSNSGRFP
jgi:CheY-like chemotaxis protein